jgi:hypothetical protein
VISITSTTKRWYWYFAFRLGLPLALFGIRHKRSASNPRGLVCGQLGPVYAELGWVRK